MKDFLRALPTDMEVMGRTVEGMALTWNRPYRVSDNQGVSFYAEGWRSRAFEAGLQPMGNIFELRVDHRDQRLGRTSFHESERGLVFTAVLDQTPDGEIALEKAKANRFRGVSLRYGSDKQHTGADGVVWRTRGVVRELSLIEGITPQYDDAGIVAVRALDDVDDVDDVIASAVAMAAERERAAAFLAIDVTTL